MRNGCVYRIGCLSNGRVYVGSSADVFRRIKDHFRKLESGDHHSVHLQNAWNKYSPDSFVFEIVSRHKSLNSLLRAEQKELDRVFRMGCQMNISPTAGSSYGVKHTAETRRKVSEGVRGRKHTEETKKKIANANTGKVKSRETRARLSAAHTGRRHTKEAREKMSRAGKGRKFSDEHRRNISKGLTGRDVSDETRKKIAKANTGKLVSSETRRKQSEAHKGKKFSKKHRENLTKATRARSKLSSQKAETIRSLYARGSWSYARLAERYGVSKAQISRIITNQGWN